MKILAYKSEENFNFDSMLEALSKTKYEIGYMAQEIKPNVIQEFAPDVIIHNINDAETFPVKTNAISININETTSEYSFSFKNSMSKNYIKPFVSIKDTDISPEQEKLFESDVVYMGSPAIFKNVLQFLCDEKNNINFKFFSHQTHNIRGYCGMCNSQDYLKFYKKSKACLVHNKDVNRIMDIVISDGNPVVYENEDQCIKDIKDAIYEDKKFTIKQYSKKDILQNHTAYDRISEIFKKIGLKKVSEDILKTKNFNLEKK
jgi:hypothetical protein